MAATTRPEDPRLPAAGLDACPRCGASLASQQEYCLDCGLRLPEPPTGAVAALGSAWKRRLRWYPGDWIWVALALLAVAAAGAAVAVAASRENSNAAPIVATTTPGVITRQAVNTTPTIGQTTSPTAPTTPSTPSPGSTGLVSWPSGQSGWTIVLRSDTSPQAARAEARRAVRKGLRDVGVLDSSDYSSLHPGYVVVFTGVYDSQAAAQQGLDAATAAGYPAANVRPVSP